MKKIKQTIFHDPPHQNGNCFPAVIATITGMPIERILPVQQMFDRDDWHISLFCWLKEKGWMWRGAPEFHFWFGLGRAPEHLNPATLVDKPYLVTGKTTRFGGEVSHVCVYMNGELWHDPHPDNTGLTTIESFEVIERFAITH